MKQIGALLLVIGSILLVSFLTLACINCCSDHKSNNEQQIIAVKDSAVCDTIVDISIETANLYDSLDFWKNKYQEMTDSFFTCKIKNDILQENTNLIKQELNNLENETKSASVQNLKNIIKHQNQMINNLKQRRK